jgi:lipopolysaccharide export system permease protein
VKTVRRLLYRDIVASVALVSLAFLSLFFFINIVEGLDGLGQRGRTFWHVLLAAVYELPANFYELFPIAVLIGTIYSLARMAQSSEFTILRTGGLGPGRALGMLALLGLAFAAVTFVVGDYLAPASEEQAVVLKASTSGGIPLGAAGAWIKEKRSTPQGERNYSISVAEASEAGVLAGIRIFEFDGEGRLVSRTEARRGLVGNDGLWTLTDVKIARWPAVRSGNRSAVVLEHLAQMPWRSTLSASVVAAAVLPASAMTAVDLWRYSDHLNNQEQAAQGHQIRFWRKALYPLACVVMVALALPFAYMHARAGGVSFKVFGGIMLGISFVLLNNLAGHIGLLQGWTPWVAAATPSGLYLLMSMAAFAWLVRYR